MIYEDIFIILLFIIYFICVGIEIKILKKNKIDIFYKENLLLIFLTSAVFPLSIFTLFFGCNAIKQFSLNNKENIAFSGYFFTFVFASLAYIIHYIKSKIYAFISNKNKLSFLGLKTIYDRKSY